METVHPSREAAPNASVGPEEDFYTYVNADWLRANPLPEDREFWGVHHVRQEELDLQIQEIVDSWLDGAAELTDNQRKAVDFYLALNDKDRYISNSARTLRPIIKRLRKTGRRQLPQSLGYLSSLGINHILKHEYGRHSEGHLVSRMDIDDYFPSVTSLSLELESGKEHFMGLARDCQSAGLPVEISLHEAAAMVDFERRLAEIGSPESDSRQDKWVYYSEEELENSFDFDFRSYFQGIAPGAEMPAFLTMNSRRLESLLELVEKTPLRLIQTYLIFCALEKSYAYLSDECQLQPGKERQLLNDYFEDVIGREYVRRHLPETRLEVIRDLVEDIRGALAARIEKAGGMDEASKERLQHKLDDIVVNIGHGRDWRNYSGIEIVPDNPLQNLFGLNQFLTHSQPAEFKDPDFMRRHLPPGFGSQTLFARASAFYRSINLPAALLERPFYDEDAHPAYNIGSIGAVIGHEFIHHFQNPRIDYSRQDILHSPWLSESEMSRFEEIIRQLAAQLENSQTVSSLETESRRLVREFSADVFGLQLALDVTKNAYPSQPKVFRHVFEAYAPASGR